jgi:hypothetical protein
MGGLLFLIIPISLFSYWIRMKGWLSVRLIAFLMFLLSSGIGTGFWWFSDIHEIFIISIVIGIIGSLIILSIPRTNPSLMKILRLKW